MAVFNCSFLHNKVKIFEYLGDNFLEDMLEINLGIFNGIKSVF